MQESQKTWVRSLSQEGPLEEEMATYSSILAGKIPWTEEPGGPQSVRLQRVGHDRAHILHHFTLPFPRWPPVASPLTCIRLPLLPRHARLTPSPPGTQGE